MSKELHRISLRLTCSVNGATLALEASHPLSYQITILTFWRNPEQGLVPDRGSQRCRSKLNSYPRHSNRKQMQACLQCMVRLSKAQGIRRTLGNKYS